MEAALHQAITVAVQAAQFRISANILSGSSSVTANGGNGYNTNCGSGGGGRVAITYNDASDASLTKQAYGGSIGSQKGGAGTIYTRDMDDPENINGDLLVDNGTVDGANTTQYNVSETYDSVTVQNYGKYVIPARIHFDNTKLNRKLNSNSHKQWNFQSYRRNHFKPRNIHKLGNARSPEPC